MFKYIINGKVFNDRLLEEGTNVWPTVQHHATKLKRYLRVDKSKPGGRTNVEKPKQTCAEGGICQGRESSGPGFHVFTKLLEEQKCR
jgi:hypothetical protein